MSTSSSSVSYHDVAHKVDPVQIPPGVDPESNDVGVEVEYPWNGRQFPNGRSVWGDEHDINSTFLPFAYLSYDPIEVLTKVGEYLNGKETTTRRISTPIIVRKAGINKSSPGRLSFDDICLIHGWWRGGSTPSSAYYCNPDYRHSHGDDILDGGVYWDPEAGDYVCDRLEFAKRATKLGLPAKVSYRPFGLDASRKTPGWLLKRGFKWDPERKKGLREMSRTWKTLNNWGYSYAELGRAFDIPRSTLTWYVQTHAPDYEPPKGDPSYRVVRR